MTRKIGALDFTLGQKYKNIFVRFLVQMKTLKFAFEINWPLVIESLLKEKILLQYPSKSVAGDNCPLSPLISPALSIICQHSTSHKSKIPPLPWTLELLEWKQLWGFSFDLRAFRMTAVIGFIISTSIKSKLPHLPWNLDLSKWKQLGGFPSLLSLNLRSSRMKAIMGFKAGFKAKVGQDKRSSWTVVHPTFLFIYKSIFNEM